MLQKLRLQRQAQVYISFFSNPFQVEQRTLRQYYEIKF